MDIVIAEDLWWHVPESITNQFSVYQDASLYQDSEKLIRIAAAAKALVVRNKTQVDRQLLNQLPNLKAIGRLGVGLDNLDLNACRERGITVVAAKGCNANAVAEYVIASLFHHSRFLSICDESVRNGRWDRQACIGRELSGKTLGLIGVGDIGQRVAIRARALGLQVLAYDPFLLPAHMLAQDFGVLFTNLNEVCRQADYISVHVPLSPSTYHLLGLTVLELMKKDAVIINTSRGGIIDEQALFSCLKNSPERFAILDVRETEPPLANDPLSMLPNTLLTPHIAGITHESSKRVAELVLHDIERVLSNQPALAAV